MKIENILEAEEEAKRFLKRLKLVKSSELNKDAFSSKTKRDCTYTSKETGALKRASMDLTRSLSKMRNNIYE
jgi:hypothetical protein